MALEDLAVVVTERVPQPGPAEWAQVVSVQDVARLWTELPDLAETDHSVEV